MGLWLAALGLLIIPAACSALLPGDDRLHYIGRSHVQVNVAVHFDWVGSGLSVRIAPGNTAGNISVVMDGGGNRFTAYRNGDVVKDFFATAGLNGTYLLTNVAGGDVVSLIKATEVGPRIGGPRAVSVFGLLADGVDVAPFGELPLRRIAFYGDSDSASYGVDGKSDDLFNCNLHMWHQENFAHGWVSAVARALEAEVRVVAESGVGVVTNALNLGVISAAATLSTQTMPKLLDRTLESVTADDYDASSWRPSVIVVYLGSNDYVNLFPPSPTEFSKAYKSMVQRILEPFGEPGPPVVHVCGGEAKPCDFIKEVANATRSIYTDTGDFGEAKLGCAGHRNAEQQAALAKRLGPVIAAAAGWASRTQLSDSLLV